MKKTNLIPPNIKPCEECKEKDFTISILQALIKDQMDKDKQNTVFCSRCHTEHAQGTMCPKCFKFGL